VRHERSLPVAVLSALLLWVIHSPHASAQSPPQAPSEEVRIEKRFFDFLIGEWTIERAETPTGVEIRGDDHYKFTKALDGNAILSEWHFNRGTKAKPDYAHAMYVTAFDTSSKAWSFYYVSEKSAQWWEGRKENSQWVFYKDFTPNGEKLLQRQMWRLKDQTTLVRVIENSKDGGKSWETYQFIMKRK
jgi:hypothetical protein